MTLQFRDADGNTATLTPKMQQVLSAIEASGWKIASYNPGMYSAAAALPEQTTPEWAQKRAWHAPTYQPTLEILFSLSRDGKRLSLFKRENKAPWLSTSTSLLTCKAALALLTEVRS